MTSILEISLIISSMEKDFISLPLEPFMKDLFNIMSKMVMERIMFPMETIIKVILSME